MGVDVAWTTERKEHEHIVGDSFQTISRLALSRWSKLNETVCLRFIDAYGDTVFNQAQMPVLLTELEADAALQDTTKDREHIEKIITLVASALGSTHTYIVFIGD